MTQAQIVGDRFPVIKQVNNELDEAREEVKREAAKIKNKKNKENILAGIAKSKYALLKSEGDLVEKEKKKLEEVYIAFLIHKRYIPDPEQLNQQRLKCAAQMREPL
ncbi:hypothetical protein myaer87_39840 [Microcystis aeruginosa NIES-87]|nr:hypothetical protein myaer87_39840 [Microcystis aeruginosa NIES-87]